MEYAPTVYINGYGGYYEPGGLFSKAKWVSIIVAYHNELKRTFSCTDRRLADICSISKKSAEKAKLLHDMGMILPAVKRGHGYSGIASMSDFQVKHHT